MRSPSATTLSRSLATFAATVLLALACSDNESGGTAGDDGGAGGSGASENAGEAGEASSSGGGAGETSGGGAGSDPGGMGGVSDSGATATAGASETAAAGAPTECATSTTTAQTTHANLLFVLDRSGSMQCNPPEGDEALNEICKTTPIKQDPTLPSKWEVTHAALREALDNLAELPNVSAGVTMFPEPDPTNVCLVSENPDIEIEPLTSSHLQDIEALLDGVEPGGETPIGGATILSYKYLSERLREGELFGNTFVVLLTDGAETCDGQQVLDQLVGTDVSNATLFNIRTFVIGAPGSEDGRGLLSQIAYEGLTAASADCDHSGDAENSGDCHFDMTTTEDFSTELSSTLEEISNQRAFTCEFDIPENPDGGGVDLKKVNVTFTQSSGDPLEIPQDDTHECEDGAEGWQYSEDLRSILLCGEICDTIKDDPDGSVDIVLGCPTIKIDEVT